MGDVSTQRMQQALARAQAFFQESRAADDAMAFIAERGLSNAVLDEFGIGFAPCDWQALVRAVDDKEAAVACGIAAEAPSRHVYARFRERLMFPIHDAEGSLVGFGGRSIADASPKYLNSPESALFSKGNLLYGLSNALSDPGLRSVGVGEGFMDVITPAQAGVPMVASMGTALTSAQVALLYAHFDELVLCMDGDAAGARAIDSALEVVLPHLTSQRGVRICELPDGHDPDSFVREHGGDEFAALMSAAPSVADYLSARSAGEGVSMARALGSLRNYITMLPDAYVQSEFLDALGQKFGGENVGALVADDADIHYLGDLPMRQGRTAAPRSATLTLEQAHVLVARALFSCPDVAQFVEVPLLDRAFGDVALGLIADAADTVAKAKANDEAVNGTALLSAWNTQVETQPFVDYAMQGRVLSPALAREAIGAAAAVIFEQTTPAFACSKGESALS